MQTASTASSSNTARQSDATFGIPNSSATLLADSGVRLATVTISTPFCSFSPGI